MGGSEPRWRPSENSCRPLDKPITRKAAENDPPAVRRIPKRFDLRVFLLSVVGAVSALLVSDYAQRYGGGSDSRAAYLLVGGVFLGRTAADAAGGTAAEGRARPQAAAGVCLFGGGDFGKLAGLSVGDYS